MKEDDRLFGYNTGREMKDLHLNEIKQKMCFIQDRS